MLFEKRLMDCVVFIGKQEGDEFIPCGTGFYVVLPYENNMEVPFIVTARHVVDELEKRSKDGRVTVRLTGIDGKLQTAIWPVTAFEKHEDDLVDVAWVNLNFDPALTNGFMVHIEAFATRAMLTEMGIGVGAEVFFPGMFTGHLGSESNVPILRRGSIAAFPNGRVKTEWGNLNLILIEARSIGGLSGSPVFATPGPCRINAAGRLEISNETPPALLLGLIHGHFASTHGAGLAGKDYATPLEVREVNMGIGMVVPADDIRAGLEKSLRSKPLIPGPRIHDHVVDVIGGMWPGFFGEENPGGGPTPGQSPG